MKHTPPSPADHPPSRLRRARRAIAALAFALALLAFLDFREAIPPSWTVWIAQWQFVPSVLRSLAGLGVGVLVFWLLLTFLFGRLYCSALCPLGIWQDLVWRVRRTLFPRRLRFAPSRPWLRCGILAIVILSSVSGIWLTLSLLDPYSLFGRFASGVFRPLVIFLNNLGVSAGISGLYRVSPGAFTISLGLALAILLLVSALAAWRGRLFCNTLCPVGSLLGLISARSLFRLAVDQSACVKCGECLTACKAQCIDLRTQQIDFSRCVACFDCVSACDRGGIGYRLAGRPAKSSALPADPALRTGLQTLLATLFLFVPFGKALAAREERHHGREGRGGARHPIMPPGAANLESFLARCTACGLCVAHCPTSALQPSFLEYGWQGFLKPRLDPRIGYCNFECTRCMEICPTGALRPLSLEVKKRTRLGSAHFHRQHCVVHVDGVDCGACSEHCPTKAVDMVPYRGNLLLPRVDDSLCIGCGACESACPVRPERAIRVSGRPIRTILPPPEKSAPPPRSPSPTDPFPF